MLILNVKIRLAKKLRATLTKLASMMLIALTILACSNNVKPPKADERLMGTQAGGFDQVLTIPGAGITPFSKVFIEEPSVSFNKHWLLDFRGDYTQRDLDRFTSSYGEMLKKAISESVAGNTQVTLVTKAIDADVIFRPLLRDLNIYAPDLSIPGRVKNYVHEIGNATFDLTLIRAGNNEVMAQFIDHRETSASPGRHLERTDRITNARYFRMLMERWSNNLTDYLIDTGAVPAKTLSNN